VQRLRETGHRLPVVAAQENHYVLYRRPAEGHLQLSLTCFQFSVCSFQLCVEVDNLVALTYGFRLPLLRFIGSRRRD